MTSLVPNSTSLIILIVRHGYGLIDVASVFPLSWLCNSSGLKSTRIDYQYHRLLSLPAGSGPKYVPASECDDEAHVVDSPADILHYLPEEI
jgi:hypothetical protein